MFGPPFVVDPARVRGVKNPLPAPTHCPYCARPVALVNNKLIYRKSIGKWPWAYLCTNEVCNSYVGLHPGTEIPLGTLANKPLRKLREQFKQVFNPLHNMPWRPTNRTRSEAYAWLAERMQIPVGECHGAWFNNEQAKIAIRLCRAELRRLNIMAVKAAPPKEQDDTKIGQERVPDWFDERNHYLAPDDGGGAQGTAQEGSEGAAR